MVAFSDLLGFVFFVESTPNARRFIKTNIRLRDEDIVAELFIRPIF